MVSPFGVGSYIKTCIYGFWLRHFFDEDPLLKEFGERLEYPVDLSELGSWVNEVNPFGIQSALRAESGYSFKAWLKSLGTRELELVHRYFNTVRNFRLARIVFHEILRRSLRWTSIFRLHGFKRALGARLLLSQIRFGDVVVGKRQYLILKLFLNVCHPIRNDRFHELVSGKTVSLIGGGKEADVSQLVDASDLVARLNKYELTADEKTRIGRKIDLVYLRGERAQYLYKEFGRNALNSYGEIFFSIKLYSLYSLFNTRNKNWCFSTDNAFPYALLNGVQAAIFDLVYNHSGNISIFGVNFNLDPAHMPGYRPKEMRSVKFDLIFGAHPPHIQFLMTRYFVQIGRVIPEGECKDLMCRNYRQFSRLFDAQWSY